LAALAGIGGSEQGQQPQPKVVDQIEDVTAQVMAFLQQQLAGSGGSPTDTAQILQRLSSMPPELQQLLSQSPAVFQQQLAIVLTQLAMDPRNALLEGRAQAMNQEIDRLKQAADQTRDAALAQMMAAISMAVSQITSTAANIPKDPQIKGPTGKTPLPTAPPAPIKNMPEPQPNPPLEGFKFVPSPTRGPAPIVHIPQLNPPPLPVPTFHLPPQLPPQLPTSPPPIVIPVAPPIPPAVQIRVPK
jgi:hypothetical protein